jgi:TPP-dependent indolepyruvate ferredoxin oxidoreductase alpha subunit
MHKLLTDNPGQEMILLGNDAIARGAIEAGVAFAATYPGTPSSEISLDFFQISQESCKQPLHAQTEEAQAEKREPEKRLPQGSICSGSQPDFGSAASK